MIYPNVITVWLKSIEGRQATWERLVYRTCRFEPVYGASAGTGGDTSARAADLLVKCHDKPFSNGDKIVPNLCVDGTPPKDAFTVQTVSPISFNNYPDHWEAELV